MIDLEIYIKYVYINKLHIYKIKQNLYNNV